MKHRIINIAMALAFVVSGMAVLIPSVAFAADAERFGDAGSDTLKCSSNFLGFPAWFNGLPRQTGTCDLQVSSEATPDDGEEQLKDGDLNAFIFRIVLNVIDIVLRIIGYTAVGFVIYGGFKYLTSTGSPDRVTAGRKIIMNALIGLGISIMSVAVVNLIAGNIT